MWRRKHKSCHDGPDGRATRLALPQMAAAMFHFSFSERGTSAGSASAEVLDGRFSWRSQNVSLRRSEASVFLVARLAACVLPRLGRKAPFVICAPSFINLSTCDGLEVEAFCLLCQGLHRGAVRRRAKTDPGNAGSCESCQVCGDIPAHGVYG